MSPKMAKCEAPRFVLIAHPENRRTAFFQEALARFGLPPAVLLRYQDLLAARISLSDALAPGDVVRFDSPGENFAVEQALLAAGAAEAEAEGSPFAAVERLAEWELDRGRILFPRQWYLGLRSVLRRWGEEASAVPGVRLPVVPADVAVMCDKRLCHAACRAGGVAVPEAVGPVGCYDELLARLDEVGWQRAFVKLAHGSSASGVVAFRRGGARQEAITSAELVRAGGEVRLYNSLRLSRYTNSDDIRDLIDALSREGVQVERWLPKASLTAGTTFDVRVVVIGGAACHLVVREGSGPMTNLHLGNRRGDVEVLRARMGETWGPLLATCERAGALFPRSLCVGVDVAIAPNFREHAVLEMNAWGDLLPGALWNGMDTFTAQVAALTPCAGTKSALPLLFAGVARPRREGGD